MRSGNFPASSLRAISAYEIPTIERHSALEMSLSSSSPDWSSAQSRNVHDGRGVSLAVLHHVLQASFIREQRSLHLRETGMAVVGTLDCASGALQVIEDGFYDIRRSYLPFSHLGGERPTEIMQKPASNATAFIKR
jgi:hypothetical protein